MATLPNFSLLNTSASPATSFSGNGTLTIPSSTANSLITVVAHNTASSATPILTGMPANWVRDVSKALTTLGVEIWHLPPANNVGGITSIAYTSSVSGVLGFAEFSGASATNAIDQVGSASINATGASSPLVCSSGGSVASVVELVITAVTSGISGKGQGVTSPPTGYQLLYYQNGGKGGSAYLAAYQIRMANIGTQTASQPFGATGAVNVAMAMATFNPVVGIIQVQNGQTQATSVATSSFFLQSTLTLNQVPLAGCTQYCAIGQSTVSTGAGSITQTGIPSTGANAWVRDTNGSGTNSNLEVWKSPNCPASGVGTTLTFANGVTSLYWTVQGVNKLDQVATPNIASCVTGTTSATTNATPSTTQAPEIAIAVFDAQSPGKSGGQYATPTNGFSLLGQSVGGSGSGTQTQVGASYKILATSSQTPSTGLSVTNTISTNQYVALLATYYAKATQSGNLLLLQCGT